MSSTFNQTPFLWGAATAGHQVEGNNRQSDIFLLESVTPSVFKEKSGQACNSYELWATDLELIRQLGLNCYRFSLEWARIEPHQGQYCDDAIHHYLDIIDGCYERGITPIVTLCHFSSPIWFSAQGGWTNPAAPHIFQRYCQKICHALGSKLQYVITFNEPNILEVLDSIGIPDGIWQEQSNMLQAAAHYCHVDKFSTINAMDKCDFALTTQHLIEGHQLAFEVIHHFNPAVQVGFSLAIIDEQAKGPHSVCESMQRKNYQRWLDVADKCDFIGIQNYEKIVWDANGATTPPEEALRNFSGAWIDPTSLRHCIEYVYHQTSKPLMVTEHGVGTDNDELRCRFLRETLNDLKNLNPTIPLLGYIHWTLIDNFEWIAGFSAHFGLYSFDKETFARTPKPSAFAFKQWIASNSGQIG